MDRRTAVVGLSALGPVLSTRVQAQAVRHARIAWVTTARAEPGDLDASMATLEPALLVSGTRYEVSVTAFCDGGGFWANSITRRESFVAP